uniref:Uncharacterized protein n=1 Tax=Zea mays TaxID=4577 RepID=B6U8L1_MAIZE|nr:hypothetical protein [Zea mays]|eukprot:NP_001145188.1 uncharacterized protein LOC100278437 [Zea mays]
MADVLVGSERRVLISGYGYGLPPQPPPPPPAESQLLGRLDQIDLRLRQLEEQQQRRPSHADPARRAPAAQHQHTKSLPAALQHVQVRSDLMDRLNLLESRIRQLSSELDLDVGGKAAGHAAHQLVLGTSSSVPPVEDPATWSDLAPVAVVDPAPAAAFGGGGGNESKSKPAAAAVGGSWSAVEILQRGARQLHRSTSSKPNAPTKVKKLQETKCACQKEKRKAERSKTSRRWFMVGC